MSALLKDIKYSNSHLSLSHKVCKVLIPGAQLDYPETLLDLLQEEVSERGRQVYVTDGLRGQKWMSCRLKRLRSQGSKSLSLLYKPPTEFGKNAEPNKCHNTGLSLFQESNTSCFLWSQSSQQKDKVWLIKKQRVEPSWILLTLENFEKNRNVLWRYIRVPLTSEDLGTFWVPLISLLT